MTVAVADPPCTARVPLWRERAMNLNKAPDGALTLSQVADKTGLKPRTITTAMHSTAHGSRSLLRSIARPLYNVHGVPYWATEQVADYIEQIGIRKDIRKEFKDLPKVDSTGAVEIQATSLRGLSVLSTVPVGTLHRWKNSEHFPKPVAIMEVASPTPQLLYSWPAYREYLKERRPRWLARHPHLDLDRVRVAR